jgi:tetratricopeptide (TPR) repeat protein
MRFCGLQSWIVWKPAQSGVGRRFLAPALLAGAAWALLSPTTALAQGWPVANAVGRVHLERAKKTAWPATVGWAQVWPAGLDPAKCNVAVFTGSGRPAGSQVIWTATGEPMKILFDSSSGEVTYDVYLYEGVPQGPAWQPEAGVLLETRARKEGPWDTWDKAWRLYQASEPVLGRSLVTNIFQGVHPHGPTVGFVGHYKAWFTAKKAGEHQFAVVSTGPAYLRVDNKVLVSRPALGGSRGRRAEYNGKTTLSAGRHQMDFLCAHPGTGEWMVEVAWREPGGKEFFELMPKEAFLQAARFDTFSWTPAPGRSNRACFEWEMLEHNLVEDQALVLVQLRTVGGRKEATCHWQFDDGTTATGSPVLHVFPQTGLRRVQFTADEKAATSATLTERINVHPQWSQLEEWRDGLFELEKKQLLARDLSATPPEDLRALVKFADTITERSLLSHLGAACLKRQADFKSYQADAFYLLGWHFQTPETRDYLSAEQCYRASLQLATDDSGLKDKSRLRLARLFTDAFNKPAEALDLLKAVRSDRLMSDYARQAKLFEGDALAAQGKIEEAVKVYRAAGDPLIQANLLRSVQGATRLENARDLIRRTEYDAADDILRQIEWETPLRRLSPETGLPMILVHLGRKEYPLALSRCQRLLYSATVDTHRADVLYCLVETELALGRADAAQQTLAKLIKDHPYSEATARAKDRWGARLGSKP